MDLSQCKLIKSCDKPGYRSGGGFSPILSSIVSTNGKTRQEKLPKISSQNTSPKKIDTSFFRYEKKAIQESRDSLELTIRCRRYYPEKASPKDIVTEAKFKERQKKFVLQTSEEHLWNNYFRPKSLTPLVVKQFVSPVLKGKNFAMSKEAESFKHLKKGYVFSIDNIN
jgi:hypothetical protein